MEYVSAYIAGGVVALFMANWLWYPAPNIHGVQLGFLMGAIFTSGAVIAMVIVAAVKTLRHLRS